MIKIGICLLLVFGLVYNLSTPATDLTAAIENIRTTRQLMGIQL